MKLTRNLGAKIKENSGYSRYKDKSSRRSIARIMLTGIGGPVLIVMIIVSLFVLFTVKKDTTKTYGNQLAAQAEAATQMVDEYFGKYEVITDSMAYNQQLINLMKDLKPGEQVREKENFKESFKTLESIHQNDSNIISLWASDFDSEQLWGSEGYFSDSSWVLADRGWYKALMADTSVHHIMTEPYFDETVNDTVVSIVSSVKDDSGKIIGAVGIDITIGAISKLISEQKIGETGYYSLVDNNFNFVYHPSSDIIGKNVSEALTDARLQKRITDREYGMLEYDLAGVQKVGYLEDSEISSWIVIANIDYKEMGAAYTAMKIALIIMFVLAFLLIMGVVVAIVNSILKPLKQLNAITDEIAEGNLDVRMDVESDTEIGAVADSIGKTVIRLNDYIGYIEEISQVLGRLAEGDIRVRLTKDYAGEFAPIKTALEEIGRSFNATLSMIHQSSEQVNQGANHVSSGAQALASGSTEQASSLQELTAQVELISAQSQNNAESATAAKKLAEESGAEVELGNSHMEDMLGAMDEISRSSEEINKIIKVIDDIAFQTNILALNAAVEAARAGEAGRGFAVVADEVRNLAARSAEAAKQTQDLISKSVQSSAVGLDIARSTAQALTRVAEKTLETSSIIDVIEELSRSQADTIKEINTGLNQVATVVQSNAATAEESSAASEELSAQANLLFEEVSRFTLEDMDNHQKNINHKAPISYMRPSFEALASQEKYPMASSDKY